MTYSIHPEEMLQAYEVATAAQFMDYACQQLGVSKPIGHKARGLMVRRIKEEMAEQRWTWKHLTAAVKYMKTRGIRGKSIDYIFYYVSDAIRDGFMPRPPASTWEALQERVSVAIYMESDTTWTNRLLAARGQALAQVYAKWEKERLPSLEGP